MDDINSRRREEGENESSCLVEIWEGEDEGTRRLDANTKRDRTLALEVQER